MWLCRRGGECCVCVRLSECPSVDRPAPVNVIFYLLLWCFFATETHLLPLFGDSVVIHCGVVPVISSNKWKKVEKKVIVIIEMLCPTESKKKKWKPMKTQWTHEFHSEYIMGLAKAHQKSLWVFSFAENSYLLMRHGLLCGVVPCISSQKNEQFHLFNNFHCNTCINQSPFHHKKIWNKNYNNMRSVHASAHWMRLPWPKFLKFQ